MHVYVCACMCLWCDICRTCVHTVLIYSLCWPNATTWPFPGGFACICVFTPVWTGVNWLCSWYWGLDQRKDFFLLFHFIFRTTIPKDLRPEAISTAWRTLVSPLRAQALSEQDWGVRWGLEQQRFGWGKESRKALWLRSVEMQGGGGGVPQ